MQTSVTSAFPISVDSLSETSCSGRDKIISKFFFLSGSLEGARPCPAVEDVLTTCKALRLLPAIRVGLKMAVAKTSCEDDPLRATNPAQGAWNASSARMHFSSIKYLKEKNEKKNIPTSHTTKPELAPGSPRADTPCGAGVYLLNPRVWFQCGCCHTILDRGKGGKSSRGASSTDKPKRSPCKLHRVKNEIKPFPTILNVSLPGSFEACTCHPRLGLLFAFAGITHGSQVRREAFTAAGCS